MPLASQPVSATTAVAEAAGVTVGCSCPDANAGVFVATVDGFSLSATFHMNVTATAPTVTGFVDTPILVGSGDTQIQVTGTEFRPWSTVFLDNSPLATTYVSGSSLSVTLPGSALADCAGPSLRVDNCEGTAAQSPPLAVPMANITALDYSVVWKGYAGDIQITGAQLAGTPGVIWDGTLSLAYVDHGDDTLTVTLPDTSGLAWSSQHTIQVQDGSGGDCVGANLLIDTLLPDSNATANECCTAADPACNSGPHPCSQIAEGTPYYGQDGHYRHPRRLHSYVQATDVITDQLTGLTWTACPAGTGGTPDCANPALMTRAAAATFCAALNTSSFAGYADWRLPSILELSTLTDLAGTDTPFIDPLFDLSNTAGHQAFWAETAVAGQSGLGWIFAFDAPTAWPWDVTLSQYVRCVRGDSFLAGDLVDNGDGTVTDQQTHLMWQVAESSSKMTWEDALSYCETSTVAGYSDWRLPDHNELTALVDFSDGAPPAIHPLLVNARPDDYWTSSSAWHLTVNDAPNAWTVDFSDGRTRSRLKGNLDAYARCVRWAR